MTHHPSHHRRTLGREIHVGREKAVAAQGFLLQATHHLVSHCQILGRIDESERVAVVQVGLVRHWIVHSQLLHRIH